jgi:hypothetical protein
MLVDEDFVEKEILKAKSYEGCSQEEDLNNPNPTDIVLKGS